MLHGELESFQPNTFYQKQNNKKDYFISTVNKRIKLFMSPFNRVNIQFYLNDIDLI